MVILGVDPGFRVTGYAIARVTPQKTSIFDYGHLPLSGQDHLATRAGRFYEFFKEKISTHQVAHIALETPFLGKNVQAFLKLGYLRGLLYLLSHQHNAQLHEFAPRQIKQAVTGFGGASKDQVARVMAQLFPALGSLGTTVKQDVTDAIAICMTGICAVRQTTAIRT